MLDLMLLIVLFAIFYSITFENHNIQNHNYLSIDYTICLRGVMAVLIVFHHISEKDSSGRIFPKLQHLGYLIVAVFFFLSGYGLMFSYLKKGKEYLKSFWRKRILYIIIIYVLITILYWGTKQLLNIGNTNISAVINSLINGHPIANNSWYIVVQIYLYILFWITFYCFNINTKYKLILLATFTFILSFAFELLGYSSIWYISNPAFALGLFWAYNRQAIDIWLNEKHLWLAITASLLLFAFFSALPVASFLELPKDEMRLMKMLCRMCSSSIFTIIIILFMRKINFKYNSIWKWLGERSLEIYLIHGIFMILLRNSILYINNDSLWLACVLLLSLASSALFYILNNKIKIVLSRSLN